MLSKHILKGTLLPAAALVAESKLKSNDDNDDCLCRPSELPIYTPDFSKNTAAPPVEETPSALENAIRTTRQTITKYSDEINAYKRVGLEHIDRSKENVEWIVDYLREEDNTLPKAGAIGIGALTGLIFGLRGGFFKRTIYATTGALGMGAVCYPKEASEYSKIALTESKKYLTIAYNFAYGDKEKVAVESEQVRDDKSSAANVKDPLEIVTETHEAAVSKSCHCPIGACLGHANENPLTDATSDPTTPTPPSSP